jgi:hypothetical protein
MNNSASVSAAGIEAKPAVVNRSPKKMVWTGRVISGLALSVFVFTVMFSLLNPAMAAQGFAHYNYPDGVLLPIFIVELAGVALYAIPRTAILGAILLTGYLGGATATHVRVSEPFYLPVIVGVLVWIGVYLREERLRALVPWRG